MQNDSWFGHTPTNDLSAFDERECISEIGKYLIFDSDDCRRTVIDGAHVSEQKLTKAVAFDVCTGNTIRALKPSAHITHTNNTHHRTVSNVTYRFGGKTFPLNQQKLHRQSIKMSTIANKLSRFHHPSQRSTATVDCDGKEMEIIENVVCGAAPSAVDTVFGVKLIKTPIGTMLAVSSDTHLLLLTYVTSKHLKHDIENLRRKGSLVLDGTECNAKPLLSIENELKQYFDGTIREFHTALYVDQTETEFQRSVWHQIHQIEFGETSSYTQLAEAIGKPKSYRAVANACGRNPFAIVIPCHRVLKADQSLGGYSSGIERKVWLLDHEKNVKR